MNQGEGIPHLFPGGKEKLSRAVEAENRRYQMGSLLLLDITAASQGKGNTWRLSSIYFFLPPHINSVFLALVISCANFVLTKR